MNNNKFRAVEQIKDEVNTHGDFLIFDFQGLQIFDKKMAKKKHIGYEIYYENGTRKGLIVPNMVSSSKNALSGELHNLFSYDQKNEIIYFPVEHAGAVVFFNTKTLTAKIHHFPLIEKSGESWYAYYDYVSDKLYGVRMTKGANELYFIFRNGFKLVKIKDVDFLPTSIIGGRMYHHVIEKDRKMENNELAWYYAVPIYDSGAESVVLDHIDVK